MRKLFLTLAVVLGGLGSMSPRACAQNAPAPTAATGQVRDIDVGVFLASLYDVNPATSSFLAEFYIWTDQRATDFDPLESMVFPGSKGQELVFKGVREVDGVQWSLRRYRSTFFHDWDLTYFPFDKHQLKFQMREGAHQALSFNFRPDVKQSGMDSHFTVPGWNVSDFHIGMENVTYTTTFGNPTGAEPEQFSWITATVTMKRTAFLLFTKLMSGAYISLAAALFACLMTTSQPPVLSGRIIVQVNCLFGAILNSRATDAVLGREDQFTLMQLLHVCIYFIIFMTMIITIRSRLLVERKEEEKAVRFERRWTVVLAAAFVVVNIILISVAALSPVEAAH